MHSNQSNFREFEKVQFELNFDFCGRANGEGATNHFTIKNNYVLHYILSGKGSFKIDGKTHFLTKNDCFILPRGIPVKYYADTDEPWEYIWIGLSGTQLESYLGRSTLMNSFTLHLQEKSKFAEQFIYLVKFYEKIEVLQDDLLLLSETYKLLYLLTSEYPQKEQRMSPRQEIFMQACQYIESHYDTKISIESLAQLLGINRTYLHRIFKDLIGISPQNFILNLRMQKSCQLLENSDYSISEIAYSVGYDDPFNFSKAFHKHQKISPSEYRKNIPKIEQ